MQAEKRKFTEIVFGLCGKVRYIVRMRKPTTPLPFNQRKFAYRRDVWIRNLLKSDLPSGAKVVAVRLALYMNEKQQTANPGHEHLGDECALSARQVQDHLRKLEDARWLLIKHVRNAGNQYWLRYWWSE